MFLLTGCLGVFGYYAISVIGSHVDELYNANMLPIVDVGAVRSATLRIRLNLWRAQVEQTPEATRRLAADIDAARAELDKSWRRYYPNGISSPEERAIADSINAQLDKFGVEAGEVLKLIVAGNYEAARSYQAENLAPMADALARNIDKDMRDNVEQAARNAQDSIALASRNRTLSVALLLVSALMAIAVPVMLVRAVTRSLENAGAVAKRVADGKLGEPVEVGRRDEIGELIGTLKEMDTRLTGTVRGIRTSSDSVLVASGQIASGNLDLSARTEQQAAALEQTAATMSQITETVKQNADNARQADKLAKNALELSDTNNTAVSEMVRTMDSISGSSEKIAEITSMIEGIAFQTNILALNAAVEAARAGEQGRGFAVVAGEVRTLAQRSSTAAKQIKELIDQSSRVVAAGTTQAADVGASMTEVVRVINMVSDIIGEIASASEEQSRGVAQVHTAISEIDTVTQQNAALVEEISAAAQSLEDQARQMQGDIMFFRLAGDPAHASRSMTSALVAEKTPTATSTPAPSGVMRRLTSPRTEIAQRGSGLPAAVGSAVKHAVSNAQTTSAPKPGIEDAWQSF